MKKLWQSKTFWVNFLSLSASVVTYLVGMEILPPDALAVATGLVLPAINLVLRYITKDEIEPLMRKK